MHVAARNCWRAEQAMASGAGDKLGQQEGKWDRGTAGQSCPRAWGQVCWDLVRQFAVGRDSAVLGGVGVSAPGICCYYWDTVGFAALVTALDNHRCHHHHFPLSRAKAVLVWLVAGPDTFRTRGTTRKRMMKMMMMMTTGSSIHCQRTLAFSRNQMEAGVVVYCRMDDCSRNFRPISPFAGGTESPWQGTSWLLLGLIGRELDGHTHCHRS